MKTLFDVSMCLSQIKHTIKPPPFLEQYYLEIWFYIQVYLIYFTSNCIVFFQSLHPRGLLAESNFFFFRSRSEISWTAPLVLQSLKSFLEGVCGVCSSSLFTVVREIDVSALCSDGSDRESPTNSLLGHSSTNTAYGND